MRRCRPSMRRSVVLVPRTCLAPLVQRGQAMIEFAIVMFVLLILLAGGVELGIAGINSYKNASAAEEAARTWAEHVGANGVSDYTIGGGRGLGDHNDLSGFSRPRIVAGSPVGYDPGLPDSDVYLFNPKPIDITVCVDNTSGAIDYTCVNPLFDNLPPAHNALYSLYQVRCLDVNDFEMECGGGNVVTTWLMRLPGKLADPDGPNEAVTLAVLDSDGNLAPDSPWNTFQLQCVAGAAADFSGCDKNDPSTCGCDTRAAPADICWSSSAPNAPLACRVRVMTRYRHHFYSFITNGFTDGTPLPAATVAELDLGVRDAASGDYVGGLGADVTAQEVGSGNASYFQVFWRTFQGCSSSRSVIDGSSLRAPVSACN